MTTLKPSKEAIELEEMLFDKCVKSGGKWRDFLAHEIIQAALDAARNQALEKAAKLVDSESGSIWDDGDLIRALKSSP